MEVKSAPDAFQVRIGPTYQTYSTNPHNSITRLWLNCEITALLTRQRAPAAGITSFPSGKHLKLGRQADWGHSIVKLHRMCQLHQHYVAGAVSSRSIVFVIDKDFADRNANCVAVWLWLAMHTDDHGLVAAHLKSVRQKSTDIHSWANFKNWKKSKLQEQ